MSDLDPRGLRAEPAAAYCGLTISKFEARVRIGDLPKPLPFGRPHVWDRHALDQALDRLSRLRLKPSRGGKVVSLEAARAGKDALRHR